ncbi:MAG: chemotaxis protein CheW, partial [Candidatus Heimdallarchaeota archaeon]|nr:chemotaxis protein CheW [Candidatus Heimdallarchaeota archaeon]
MSGRTVRGKDPAKFTQVDENIILCKISGYQFSIEELSVIEILPIQVQISSVPGSPKWVKGVFDFHGDSIPIISLASWLELSENDNNANICIVLKSQNKTFAILSETVTTITKPDKSYFKHPGDKVLKNLLYKNIFNYADEKTFVLNVDVIAENFAQDTLSANWKLWMEFVHTQKESIKLKEGPRKKSVTQNLAKLEYRGLKILLTVDDSFNIYPDTNVFHELQNFPNYYIGTVDLDNRVSVAIDFSKFLKLPFVEVEGKHVYLKLGDFMGDIAMKVPVPNIIHVDIEKSRTLTKKTSKLNVPSAKYILLENEIYLYMDSSQLLKFFQNEFINMLKEEWQKNIPKWDIKPEEIAMPEHHIIKSTRVATETSAPTSVVVDEYVVCDLGQIKIAFEQKYLYQLISNDVVISSIPDAPEWVFGVMDHESEDVVVIDMAKWLDIKVNQNNPRMVVLEIYNRKISFPCLNTELVEKSIADQSYFRETLIKKKGIPFGNIFRDVKHGYVFLLNEEQLLSAAYQTYFQDIWKENWNEFLHIGKVNIKTTISMEFQRLSELDSVITNIEGHSFVLPVEYIETIRETNKQELLYQGIPIIA